MASVLYSGSSNWSSAIDISNTAYMGYNAKQSLNGFGFGTIVWQESVVEGVAPEYVYSKSFQINSSSLTFGSTLGISNDTILSNTGVAPDIFVDSRGNAVASWFNGGDSPFANVAFLPYQTAGAWINRQQVSSITTSGGSAGLFINASGKGNMIWTSSPGGIQSSLLFIYNPADVLYNQFYNSVRYLKGVR